MNDKIRFILVGSGNIANTYFSAIENIEDAETVGIISRQLRPSPFPENIIIKKSLSEFPGDSFDAVIICTPNSFHSIGTIEAANLGKHVLCEKPVDIDSHAIDNMINTCKEKKVKLGVAYQRRFGSDNPIIKELIDANKLGKIFSVDLSIKNYRNDAYYNSSPYRGTFAVDGGGPFMQQASHYIDLYHWYFGRPLKLVSKLNTFVHDIEVEDHGSVICEHENGMIGTITASTATKPGFPARLEIYSDKGYLIMINDAITEWEIEGVVNPSEHKSENKHTGSSSPLVNDTQNHELLIKDFIESIRTGKEPLVTGESAKITTEIVLDIYNNQF